MAALVDLVQQAAITAGGPTQDFPTGGSSVFSTSEPVKAGLFWLAPSTTAGTALDHARICFGITDGTRHRFFSIRSRDAQTTSSCLRQAGTDNLVWIYAAGTATAAGAMAFSSMASNKIVGTWGTLPPAAWLVNALLFGGSDCQAYVGEFVSSASQDGTTVVDATSDPNFGFAFDLMFLFSRNTAMNGTSGNDAILSIGIVTFEDGTTIKQGCLSFSDENGLATKRVGAEIEDDRCMRHHIMGGPTEGDSVEITARSSVGFTATKRGAIGNSPNVGFLALKFNGALQGLKLFANTSRTTTGSQSITTPGFPTQALVGLFSHLTALNTLDTTDDGGTFGFGAAVSSTVEACSAYMSKDNVGTSDTKCETSAVLIDVPTSSGGAGITADVTTLPTSTGATLNYSAVLAGGVARQQLILAIGRNNVRASASTVCGGVERAVGRAAHGGRARVSDGGVERAPGKAQHGGRASATSADVESGKGSAQHGGRARAASGGVERAPGRAAHGGRASAADGATERAAGKAAHGGRAAAAPGSVESGSPTVPHVATASARTTAGSIESAAAKVPHGARAVDQAGLPGRGKASVAHGGRARTTSGGQEKASGGSRKGARARTADGSSERGAPRVAHGAKASDASGGVERAPGRAAHGGRAQATPGAVEQGAASVPHATSASAYATGGSVERAQAKIPHGGRAQAQDGSTERGAPRVAHGGRARTAAGGTEKGAPKKPAGARAKDQGGDTSRSAAKRGVYGRATAASGGTERGAPRVPHAARAADASGAAEGGRAKVPHGARARSVAGEVSQALLSPPEVIGFYERTARVVRGLVRTLAGGLQVQYANLRFSPPTGQAWARARVDFDEIEEVQYGSGLASYVVPGALQLELRVPLAEGKKAAMDLADSFAEQIQMRQLSGVAYQAAQVEQLGRDGDDYRARLTVKFRAQDTHFSRAAAGVPADDDFQGAEAQIRARFRTLLSDVVVVYDNLPASAVGGTWVKLSIFETEAFDVDGSARRTVGVMQANVHTPLLEGEKSALKLADRIVEAFRLVDSGGVVFQVPYLQPARQESESWVQPIFCPWTTDHA